MSMGRRTKHKVIFALIVITTVLLIVWAGYVNYRNVAVENNATIMADLITYLEDTTFNYQVIKDTLFIWNFFWPWLIAYLI
jgi:hypothetical protein